MALYSNHFNYELRISNCVEEGGRGILALALICRSDIYDGLFRDANSKTLCDEAIAIFRRIFIYLSESDLAPYLL
ncbi:hypothetical protein N0Y54_14435 [Nostoc punctiforme UO1]